MENPVTFHLFLIFAGAAVLATAALWVRQALIVAYIVLGMLLGPALLNLIPDLELIEQIADIGIVFLLFLLGLNLHPQKLVSLFRSTATLTFISSLVFALAGFAVATIWGLAAADASVVGIAMMFSSTIIGLKLLPTTVLHHQHTGELIISILLLQDIIAIIALVLLQAASSGSAQASQLLWLALALPLIALLAKLLQQHLLHRLFLRFSRIQEYLFLVAIAWCLGFAELAHWIGLSAEMGAFIAGVALAASPISTFIAESLKPLRDFFLILFFFGLGASAELSAIGTIAVPAVVLAALLLWLKPKVFQLLLQRSGEASERSLEIGVRLGQVSEFSLLITALALNLQLISAAAGLLIQTTALITFLVSPYLIVTRFPTPIAMSKRLHRD